MLLKDSKTGGGGRGGGGGVGEPALLRRAGTQRYRPFGGITGTKDSYDGF